MGNRHLEPPPYPIGSVPLKGVLVTDFAKFVGPTVPITLLVPFKEKPTPGVLTVLKLLPVEYIAFDFFFKVAIDIMFMYILIIQKENFFDHNFRINILIKTNITLYDK